MFQNIIVGIIIVAALVYVAYTLFNSVRPSAKPGSACGGCTGCALKNTENSCNHNA
jgi:hypothetical protein